MWRLILPELFWVPLFAIATGLFGLSTLWKMRKQLGAAQRRTRLPTALVGTLLVVVLPLAAGALGGRFAWHRGLAQTIERAPEEAVDQGAASLKAALGLSDPQKKLSTDDLRSLLRMYGDKWPLRERVFFRAAELALARSHRELTWDELMVGTRLALRSEELVKKAAQPFKEAAKRDLWALALMLVFVHGGTLTIVWFVCRKRLTVVG